jgi:putative tryptophan/tyrosine transport system substrate-binding protein
MRRREFIGLIGGAAAAWPLTARAQQSAMPVIGVLSPRASETDVPLLEFFREGLKQLGYVEGHNVAIEYRGASGEYDRLPALAAELIEHHVQVIVTFGGPPSILAAKSRTAAIPVVFIGGDPVEYGFVPSFNRPGGNITGVTTLFEDVASKQLALAFELLPQAKSLGVLINPTYSAAEKSAKEFLGASHALGRQVEIVNARSPDDIEAAFERAHSKGTGGVVVAVDPFFFTQATHLVALGLRHRLPTIFWRRELCDAGGLMCYGANPKEAYVQVGIYAGRILRGEKPADLPIVQSTTFELVINLKAAKALGITVPPMLLARADEVIE